MIRMSEELPRAVSKVIEAVRSLGLAGVCSSDWLRLKLESQRAFVIGGFRPDGASIDALLVGYYEGKALRFAGKVRADFVLHVRRQVCEIAASLMATFASKIRRVRLAGRGRRRLAGRPISRLCPRGGEDVACGRACADEVRTLTERQVASAD